MVGDDCIPALSQIVILNASPNNHILCGDPIITFCDDRRMSNHDKNGGPNHLKAWRDYREMTQQGLAEAVGTSQHQIAYLEGGERALSAKWLRKLAPALKITPGFLLDHNPNDLPSDIIEMWTKADPRQRRQISAIAETILKDGTTGQSEH
jgi:transcriptional regulator with XRE-family HTH domain